MRSFTVWSFVGLLAGCAPAIEVSEVVSGIYTFKATTQTDSCTPPRFAGELDRPEAIFTVPETLSIVDAGLHETSRYELYAKDDYSLRIPRSGERILPCSESRDGSIAKTYTLAAASKDRIEVDAVEDWVVPPSCPDRSAGPFGTPKVSCHSQRTLVYELKMECSQPCAVKQGATWKDLYCDCSSPTR